MIFSRALLKIYSKKLDGRVRIIVLLTIIPELFHSIVKSLVKKRRTDYIVLTIGNGFGTSGK